MNRKWDKSRPPTGAFQLNKNCPQAQGLVWWTPLLSSNLAQNRAGLLSMLFVPGTAGATQRGQYGESVVSFASASSQYLTSPVIPISAYPFSIGGWFKPTTLVTSCLIAGSDTATALQTYFTVLFSDGTFGCQIKSNAPNGVATTTALATAGRWNHGLGVFTAAASRTAVLNGGNEVTTTSNSNTFPTGLDNTVIGARIDSAPSLYTNSEMGEQGCWDRALDAVSWQRLYSPSTRYELWYPLRSPKWISMPVEAAAGGLLYHPGMEGQMSKRMDGGLNA